MSEKSPNSESRPQRQITLAVDLLTRSISLFWCVEKIRNVRQKRVAATDTNKCGEPDVVLSWHRRKRITSSICGGWQRATSFLLSLEGAIALVTLEGFAQDKNAFLLLAYTQSMVSVGFVESVPKHMMGFQNRSRWGQTCYISFKPPEGQTG